MVLKFNYYFKYSKLFMFNCYRGIVPLLKQRDHKYFFNIKTLFLQKNYFFFDFYCFLIFIQKLRRIVRAILAHKGKFVFINKYLDLINLFKNLVKTNNQLYFNFHKSLFSNTLFIKSFIFKGVLVELNFLINYKYISFVILLFTNKLSLQRGRVFTDIKKKNLPILHLSQSQLYGDFFLPNFCNIRGSYYWVFLVLRLILEESILYKNINVSTRALKKKV